MARPLRITYPDAWYHVMNRGRRKEKIYLVDRDCHTFLDLLKTASEFWKVNIAAYCLMPNHYHLLIHTPTGNLSRFMRHINGIYTQKFNLHHSLDGQLFRGRFKSVLVSGEEYLIELLRYIHRNPLRTSLVTHLNDYKWCSHQGYLSGSGKWNWLFKEYMLGIFSIKRSEQKGAYKKYVNRDENEKTLQMLNSKKWPIFFGSDEFIRSVKKKYFQEKQDPEIPDSKYLVPDKADIINTICEVYQVNPENLYTFHRRTTNEARNLTIFLLRTLRNDTLGRLSREFNMKSPSSVNSVIRKVKKQMLSNSNFKSKVDDLGRLCLKSKKQT